MPLRSFVLPLSLIFLCGFFFGNLLQAACQRKIFHLTVCAPDKYSFANHNFISYLCVQGSCRRQVIFESSEALNFLDRVDLQIGNFKRNGQYPAGKERKTGYYSQELELAFAISGQQGRKNISIFKVLLIISFINTKRLIAQGLVVLGKLLLIKRSF